MGGDLNLKKSWHPSLLRNQERVWAQEKRALDERKKVEQLRREREEERQIQELQRLQESSGKTAQHTRVDWMYQAPSSATGHYSEEMEGYLLGKRRIDGILLKNDTDNQKLEKGADVVGVNAAAGPSVGSARDTMTKVLNDPLLEVKKREQAAYEAAVMEAARRKEREERRKGDRDRPRDRRHRDHDSKRRRYSDEGEDGGRHRHHRLPRSGLTADPEASETVSTTVAVEMMTVSAGLIMSELDETTATVIGSVIAVITEREETPTPTAPEIETQVIDGIVIRTTTATDPHDGHLLDNARHPQIRPKLTTTTPTVTDETTPDEPSITATTHTTETVPPPPPRAAPNKPDPKEQEEERLRKLAEMQSNASEIEADRRQRLNDISMKEEEQKEEDDKQRSDRGRFMSQVHRRVQEDSLDERIRRSRGGLSKMED
ncbi:uncharacterized protein N7482_001975 [Penicillium canariense]|uniref:CBF1-interacting co-repressor CIR N-terminal domain-containing protein n=1 Tax=Penicillium canariense TaxID=189055 RepID=A0A9W9IG59_9EURO|nr:uncharacterized protein N7482_001975 [Penicillium canariense]KAJ5176098.1 hypothetical protein N7482_001975 [Penicillium canariense]